MNLPAQTPKFVIVHREGAGNQAEGCVIVRSVKPSREQTVNRKGRSEMYDVEGRSF